MQNNKINQLNSYNARNMENGTFTFVMMFLLKKVKIFLKMYYIYNIYYFYYRIKQLNLLIDN